MLVCPRKYFSSIIFHQASYFEVIIDLHNYKKEHGGPKSLLSSFCPLVTSPRTTVQGHCQDIDIDNQGTDRLSPSPPGSLMMPCVPHPPLSCPYHLLLIHGNHRSVFHFYNFPISRIYRNGIIQYVTFKIRHNFLEIHSGRMYQLFVSVARWPSMAGCATL